LLLAGCGSKPGEDYTTSDLAPKIEPDYSAVTIPPNIAPLNFIIKETAEAFYVKFSSGSGDEFEVLSNIKLAVEEFIDNHEYIEFIGFSSFDDQTMKGCSLFNNGCYSRPMMRPEFINKNNDDLIL
jgi:hypothetical protein